MATLTPELRREWIASRERQLDTINQRISDNRIRLAQLAVFNERASPVYRQNTAGVIFALEHWHSEKDRLEGEIASLREAA